MKIPNLGLRVFVAMHFDQVSREFCAGARSSSIGEDQKQIVADAVMGRLADLHNKAEAIRKKYFQLVINKNYCPSNLLTCAGDGENIRCRACTPRKNVYTRCWII